MSYETKPGNGSMFKNTKKEKDNHPDYTGNAVLPDGTPVWLSGWIKKANSGDTYMSIAIKPKDAAKADAAPPEKSAAPFDDSIPF